MPGRIVLLLTKTIVLNFCLASTAFAQMISGEVSHIGDATHFEFSGRENWKYKVNQISDTLIEIEVPQFNAEITT